MFLCIAVLHRELTNCSQSGGMNGWRRSVKGKRSCIAVNRTPFLSYGVSLAIWDHTVLPPPDTSESTPPSPQPDSLVLDLPTPEGGMEG